MPVEVNMSSTKYLRGRTGTPTTGRTGTPTFAMTPGEVLFDRRLSDADIRVHDVMAYFRDGDVVNTGERKLAGGARKDRRTLRRCISRLIRFGWIQRLYDDEPLVADGPVNREPKWNPRARYRLTSPIFSVPAFGEPAQTAFTPPLVTCPRCHKPCGGVLKAGWCRRCAADVRLDQKVERKVREEIARTA